MVFAAKFLREASHKLIAEVMDTVSTPLTGVQRNGGEEDPAKIFFAFDIETGSISTPTILTTIIRISDVVVKSDSKFTRHPR